MNLFKKFNITPKDPKLYEIALTHGSFDAEEDVHYSYERLEFLGDSVLNLIVSEYLFKKFPKANEGFLSKIRANYICQSALIEYSHEVGLEKHLKASLEGNVMSDNEILSVTADIFESFLGAIFLDQGMNFAKNYISNIIFKHIDEGKQFFADYKTAIKEYGDAEGLSIEYEIVDEYGFAHDKTFISNILIDGEKFGVGKGKSKKESEQIAAKKAMEALNIGIWGKE